METCSPIVPHPPHRPPLSPTAIRVPSLLPEKGEWHCVRQAGQGLLPHPSLLQGHRPTRDPFHDTGACHHFTSLPPGQALGLLHPHQTGSLPGLSTFNATATLTHEVRLLQRLGSKASFSGVSAGVLAGRGWYPLGLPHLSSSLRYICFSPTPSDPQGHRYLQRGRLCGHSLFLLPQAQCSAPSAPLPLPVPYGCTQRPYLLCSEDRAHPLAHLSGALSPLQGRSPSGRPVHVPQERVEVAWLLVYALPLPERSFQQTAFPCPGGPGYSQEALPPRGKAFPHTSTTGWPLPSSPPSFLYGANLFTPSMRMQDKLDVFWHRVQRGVTNCSSSTPVPILAIVSCLPPLVLLIEHRQCMAALRMVCSPPEINPAWARLHKSVPNRSSFHSLLCHHSLLVKLNPALHLLMWSTPQMNIRKHLPIDEITHRTLPLLKDRPFFLLLNPQLVSTMAVTPADPSSDSYTALKKESRSILLLHWASLAPPPPRLRVPPLAYARSLHGSFQVPGRPLPSDAIRQELPCSPFLQVQSRRSLHLP